MKNSKPLSLLFLCLCFAIGLIAQQDTSFVIKGQIKVAETGEFLPLVNVFNISSQKGTISDDNGEFELKIEKWPALLQFTYLGYEPLALWIKGKEDQWLDIQLHPYFATLPDVVVSAKPAIESLTKPSFTVRDYVFIEDKLLLATLPGIQQGTALVLMDEEGNVLDSVSINKMGRFDFLAKSCLGKIHLITINDHYEIDVDRNRIQFVGHGSRKEYSREIEPCVGATDSLLIYRYRYCIGQLLRFRAFEKYADKEFLFAEVSNDENLERRYQEELASSVGYIDRLNISWEEKQQELKRALENNIKLAGLVHLFYKPIDIPFIQLGETFLLFNHLKGQLQFYDLQGFEKKNIPINFQKEKKWDGTILSDDLLNNIYTIFDHPKGKIIREIHLENGTLGRPILIDCLMVENIKINNGKLYYLESGRGVAEYNRVLKKVKIL